MRRLLRQLIFSQCAVHRRGRPGFRFAQPGLRRAPHAELTNHQRIL